MTDFLDMIGETKLIQYCVELLQMIDQVTGGNESRELVEIPNLPGHYSGRNECNLEDDLSSQFSFKRVLVKILANVCSDHKANQDRIREHGGIEAILNCCRVDENHPYIKEWALFAVRNLTKDNPENIAHIEQYTLSGVRQSPDLSQMGLQAQIDSGRVRVTRVDEMM